MYQVSYRTGTKVTRMYDSNSSPSKILNANHQDSNGFLLFGFKMFASENMPDKVKSKGFLERIVPLKAVPGDPEFDISEVVDGSGDEQFKELYQELEDTRKLLFMYRLLNHNETIPDVKLNIKNRYKQLTKPLIRLFQSTQSVNDIVKSLSKYLIEKNQEKIDSLDSAILNFIINLVSKYGETLYNDQIWKELKKKYRDGEIPDKLYSWYLEGYGSISKNSITKICETKFGAKPYRDSEKGRGLIFNQKTLNKLIVNYSIIDEIKIIKEEKKKDEEKDCNPQNSYDTCDTNDTFTGMQVKIVKDSVTKNANNMTEMTQEPEGSNPQNSNITTKIDTNSDTKPNTHSSEVSYVSYPSCDTTNTKDQESSSEIPYVAISSQQSNNKKLFNNPLISESDLLTGNYDPQVINNIDRVHPHSDRWLCYNCTMRGDKWFMMKHPCKNNINNKGGSKLI